jgi:hypothetical protein
MNTKTAKEMWITNNFFEKINIFDIILTFSIKVYCSSIFKIRYLLWFLIKNSSIPIFYFNKPLQINSLSDNHPLLSFTLLKLFLLNELNLCEHVSLFKKYHSKYK